MFASLKKLEFKRSIVFISILAGTLILAACSDSDYAEGDKDDETTDDAVNYSEEVDYTITGIEPGAGISVATEKAIEEYDSLQGWDVELSSTAAMMSELDQAMNKEEPIIITEIGRAHV